MNKENNVIIKVYQVAIILRECLEYTLDKHLVNKELHKKRGDYFNKLIMEDTIPLLLKQNIEVKNKIMHQLNEFGVDVFKDNKYFLYENDEFYRNDDASRIKLFEYIVGLYQTMIDIIDSLIKQIKSSGTLEPLVEDVINNEKNLYTSRASLVIFSDIVRQSSELNKQLGELKNVNEGKAQVQFLVNDLRKTVGFTKFIQEKYNVNKEEVTLLFPLIEDTLKKLDGSNKVSNEELVKAIKITLSYCGALNQVYERVLNVKYTLLISEINAKIKTYKLKR
jgi:hypothetical protein